MRDANGFVYLYAGLKPAGTSLGRGTGQYSALSPARGAVLTLHDS